MGITARARRERTARATAGVPDGNHQQPDARRVRIPHLLKLRGILQEWQAFDRELIERQRTQGVPGAEARPAWRRAPALREPPPAADRSVRGGTDGELPAAEQDPRRLDDPARP